MPFNLLIMTENIFYYLIILINSQMKSRDLRVLFNLITFTYSNEVVI